MKEEVPCKQCVVLAMCINKSEIFCNSLWYFLESFNGSHIGTEAWRWLEEMLIHRAGHIEVLIHNDILADGPYRMREDIKPYAYRIT